jgi:PAS domain S-box-containing protein
MGAWAWDIASGKVIWSPGLERIHGLEEGTFGGSFEDFASDVHPEDAEALAAKIERALKMRENYHVVYRIRRPDGEVRWLEAFGRLTMAAGGEPQKLAGVCMDITDRRQAEMQRDLLVAELSHRVKNTLTTVLSIARQSFSKTPSAEEASKTFSARIRALAQTHGRLAEVKWSGVSLETIFLDELAPYRDQDDRNIRILGPFVTLKPKCALTLGMAIHELATNAAKYGALSTSAGSIDIAWEIDQTGRELRIGWAERGGPPVTQPSGSGFGRLLLERVLTSDLKGGVKLDFARSGLQCKISIPLNEHTA